MAWSLTETVGTTKSTAWIGAPTWTGWARWGRCQVGGRCKANRSLQTKVWTATNSMNDIVLFLKTHLLTLHSSIYKVNIGQDEI